MRTCRRRHTALRMARLGSQATSAAGPVADVLACHPPCHHIVPQEHQNNSAGVVSFPLRPVR